MSPLGEVATLFLKLGFTAFGGPAAHIGIMHEEVVVRRKRLTAGGTPAGFLVSSSIDTIGECRTPPSI